MTHDDPKLTAYALNELDEADRAEVEAFLAENEAARRFVEETRRTVAMLTEGLQAATLPSLTAMQRETIAAAATTPAIKSPALSYEPIRRTGRGRWAKWALATAACAALATAGFSVIRFRQAEINRQLANASRVTSQPSNIKAVIATLVERSQERIRKRDYKQSLAILTQILELDPNNDYARGAYPLVYDIGQLVPQHHVETREREITNSLNATEPTIPYEDVLRYPGNWPELSLQPSGVTRTVQVPDGGTLSLGGQTLPGVIQSTGGNTGLGAAGEVRFYAKLTPDQNSVGFTSSPSTGVPGSIGATGAGASGYIAEPTLQLSAGTTSTDAGTHNGYEMRRIKSGKSIAYNDAGGRGGGGGGRGGAGGYIPYVDRFNNFGNATLQNGTAQGQSQFDAEAAHGTSGQVLSRGDLDALVAHYRNRGPDGYHLLDGGVVGYTQAQFEQDAKTGNFPPEVITAMQRQAERTANVPNESYAAINDNPFLAVAEQPLSTFSIDVDTGSYSNIRRFLNEGHFPPPDAVRIEEMLNYFPYRYETPKSDSKEPFAATVEVAGCPWNGAHRLARVAIKGREIAHDKRPVSNLVFLIDVSGSMNEPKRLPLVKEGLKLMVNELTENDRISIVVYAGNAGLVLPSTTADPKHKQTILDAIENLSAGGSTNGGQGIELAYKMASDNFIKGGTNRVLLATDGDWNVGVTDQTSLMHLIEDKAKSGVFLSVLGYGFGNLKDSTMEKLADKGNGHYAYIDGIKEAKKVLIEEMSSTLVTIAKDVKIQVEFNPLKVESYRLIGYEKRLLRKEDFNNDKVDAGEIGAGHCVTALYEITPLSGDAKGETPTTQPQQAEVDALKYQKHEIVQSDDLMTLKMRYKQPDGEKSTKIEFPAVDKGIAYAKASEDFKFSAAVAQFGMILRNSPHKGTASLDGVLELADEGKGKDEKGYRTEFLELVKKARALSK